MSGSDILVPDSDSDHDSEGRVKRIAQMEQRYRAGNNLFIMSASIKGQLKSSPWARKRKRPTSSENISTYYPVKKVVKGSPERNNKAAPRVDDQHVETVHGIQRLSPIWDNTLQPKVPAKPTARLIDFRQYDSQIPSQLLPKVAKEATRDAQVQTIDLSRPSTRLRVTDAVDTAMTEGQAAIRENGSLSPATRSHDEARRLSMPTIVSTERATDQRGVDGSCAISSKAQSSQASPKLPAPSSEVYDVHHDLAVDEIITTSPLASGKRIVSNDLGTKSKDLASNDLQESFSDPIINTQAEMASAQRGLASALQFSIDSPAGGFECDALEQDSEMPRGPSEHQQSRENEILDLFTGDAPHESSTKSSPSIVPVNKSISKDSEVLSLISIPPSTPPKIPDTVAPTFAQFQSPVATPGSVLSFGSPLTFSPQRHRSISSPGLRKSGTIEDLHKYLQDSVFDIDREAQQLVEDIDKQ